MTLVAVRRRMERWAEVRALVRQLQRIIEIHGYLDEGPSWSADVADRAMDGLRVRLDHEATQVTVEAALVYLARAERRRQRRSA